MRGKRGKRGLRAAPPSCARRVVRLRRGKGADGGKLSALVNAWNMAPGQSPGLPYFFPKGSIH